MKEQMTKARIKALAQQALKTRWEPMCEAKTIDEMKDITKRNPCLFCKANNFARNGCDGCPLNTGESCCDGLWREFYKACYSEDYGTAHDFAVKIRDYLITFTK